ncbi:MAG: hypothetical protein U0457_15265 [Candidatus Sericytochromatia bacterium]
MENFLDTNFEQLDNNMFDIFYIQALKDLNAYQVNFLDKKFLEKALNNFLLSIELNKEKAESYAYISYCMFIISEVELAKKYLDIAKLLNKDAEIVIRMIETFKNYNSNSNKINKSNLSLKLYSKLNSTYSKFINKYYFNTKVSDKFLDNFK